MTLLLDFDSRLEQAISEALDKDLKAAVAVIQNGKRWLLGLSTSDDDRKGKWCMPGGGIKKGESPEEAAVREAWEETGVKCKAIGSHFVLATKRHVAFVHCKTTKKYPDFKNNHEFSGLGFFTTQEMRGLKLYHNVLKLIDRVS